MNRKAKAIQVWGTGSGVGKSVIVSALCRIFLQDGFRVCPFKAQNMALNSYVTEDGGEIGRAQAVQASAAKINPTVDINPILLKPSAERKAQVIIKGRPLRNMSVVEYTRYKREAFKVVKQSYSKLANEYDIMVIEGAGSPAEINLKHHDIVNLKMAEFADCPVILVGDIDKGGVFAWIIGTLELLTKREKSRVRGFIINKFRGDKRLLKSGIDFLEKKTGKKVLGVIPYFRDIMIPEEDSVYLNHRRAWPASNKSQGRQLTNQRLKTKLINIAVIRLPHISNFTDFDALEQEKDVVLRYIDRPQDLNSPDIIILPGSKNTIEDLLWLKKSSLTDKILSSFYSLPAGRQGLLSTQIIGICGGYQMLGEEILDAKHVESSRTIIKALGLLPIKTVFKTNKSLSQVEAIELSSGLRIKGYEIHHGHSYALNGIKPLFKIIKANNQKINRLDGFEGHHGKVWGSYIHGIFDNNTFRRNFLNKIRVKKGLPVLVAKDIFNIDKELDKLAMHIRNNIDLGAIYSALSTK